MLKKWLVLIIAFAFLLTACGAQQAADQKETETSVPAETTASTQELPEVEAGIYMINEYGNIILTIRPVSMEELGYELADVVKVRIGDSEMEMPIVTNYSDADSGEAVFCFKTTSDGSEIILMALNSGNLAEAMGIAEMETTDEDPGYKWTYLNGLDENVPVYITLEEKQGYLDEFELHQSINPRTNKREDYPNLTDADYANFRAIETTGMGAGMLYRSSSPINPALNRNQEADECLLTAQIRTVMNMADTENSMTEYADYGLTNYSGCDIIALGMSMDPLSEEYQQDLADGFRYIASHDGPYLIHCKEGKDRTGFAAAVLECLMGADIEEVVKDYMLTFYNFYGVEPGSTQYDEIAEGNIETTLAKAFGVRSVRDENINLQEEAEKYLKKIGMTEDEIASLKDKLGKPYEGK